MIVAIDAQESRPGEICGGGDGAKLKVGWGGFDWGAQACDGVDGAVAVGIGA